MVGAPDEVGKVEGLKVGTTDGVNEGV